MVIHVQHIHLTVPQTICCLISDLYTAHWQTALFCRVAMVEWLARQTPNQKIVGSSLAKSQLAPQKPSHVGYGWRQWYLSSFNRKWVPGYRQRWQLYLDYPWRLEVCKRVYTPQGGEQVMDAKGLPGIVICKALWASFGKEKALYKNCILLLLLL